MRRTYGRERYLDRVAMIRELVPDCAITTDIIVGFPGETEEDFAETLEVVEQVRYDSAFTFIYSPRRETRGGATLAGPGLPDEVGQRAHGAAGGGGAAPRHRARPALRRPDDGRAGRGAVGTDPSRLRGRMRHNKTVNFAGVAAAGDRTDVQITSATSTTLAGEELLVEQYAERSV